MQFPMKSVAFTTMYQSGKEVTTLCGYDVNSNTLFDVVSILPEFDIVRQFITLSNGVELDVKNDGLNYYIIQNNSQSLKGCFNVSHN